MKCESKDREYLENFRRTWHFHHPLQPEQVDSAGKNDTISQVSFYHGGDVLYKLKHAPGTWHEDCLEPNTK
jgi:hypothetical protein